MTFCIWVDCDEVLSETINELLNRTPLVEKGIKRNDITSYYLSEVKKIWISQEEAVAAFYSFFESSDYYQTQAVSWAYEKLLERKNQWHKLFVVTARADPYKQKTEEWVESHFPWIFSDYLFMNQYTQNEIPKSELCRQKWIQILIDDNIQNIHDVNSLWMPWILLDKPRNQWVEDSALLKRAYSRDEMDLSRFKIK